MLKKNKIVILLLLVVTSCVLFILNNNHKDDVEDGAIKIGYCADNLVIERWKRDQAIFKEMAELNGVEVIYHNANESNETQIQQIESLIQEKVDVIVVIPYDKDGITDVINKAIKAGIKVISYDRLISDADVDVYISFDNLKVGELMAEGLVKRVPQGHYVIINGSPEDNNSSMFRQGYMKVLTPYIESGAIQIIKEGWADNWREQPAYDLISNVLKNNEKIDAVIGANDRLAEAAIKSLVEYGLAGEVYVAGHDADISACQRIIEGTQHITIYKPIRLLAESAFNLAVQLANGDAVVADETISNGLYDVPFIKLDVIAVTKDNMLETVIKDGFHDQEDVYRE